jgi:hypothetical protein
MRAAEIVTVAALAAVVTAVVAAPVLVAPSERVFGMEIVGRHHDPFTVMEQFGRPMTRGVYWQPVTDVGGALVARVAGVVGAYNWIVLVTFPLAAAAAYALARHLKLSPAAAAVAATAFAFSPFHIAHAAYHPHVAQVHWVPLYFLAVWRCMDRPSAAAMGWLAAATVAVTLANFYSGLIVAVLTPVAVGAYWFATRDTRSPRGLALTAATLMVLAAAGFAYAATTAGDAVLNRAAFAFPRADLFRYSAQWWSYLVPPVAHPLIGDDALRFWAARGVRAGLLEQQVALGWGIVLLAAVAAVRWLVVPRATPRGALAAVPLLLAVGGAALLCSLSPEGTLGPVTFVRPSAVLYEVVPMFRSYARFGVVVQLMAALLAAVGIDQLRRMRTTQASTAGLVLLTMAAAEYAVSPALLWRDALPTAAHRWVLRQGGRVRALDCAPPTPESAWVQALTDSRILALGGPAGDCLEPGLPGKLAATGYTHVLLRRNTPERLWYANRPPPDGLRLQARLRDGDVLGVTADAPPVYTASLTSFFDRERDAGWTWRWMGGPAAWTVVNTTDRPAAAWLSIELVAFHERRRLEVRLDGRLLDTLSVAPERHVYRLGPLDIAPGTHTITFHPLEPPTVADRADGHGDARALSFALGTWRWTVRSEQP